MGRKGDTSEGLRLVVHLANSFASIKNVRVRFTPRCVGHVGHDGLERFSCVVAVVERDGIEAPSP